MKDTETLQQYHILSVLFNTHFFVPDTVRFMYSTTKKY